MSSSADDEAWDAALVRPDPRSAHSVAVRDGSLSPSAAAGGRGRDNNDDDVAEDTGGAWLHRGRTEGAAPLSPIRSPARGLAGLEEGGAEDEQEEEEDDSGWGRKRAAAPSLTFAPVHVTDIPPPTLREYHVVFNDIDYLRQGWVTPGEVERALLVNTIRLSSLEMRLLLRAMDPDSTGRVAFEPFARALYALSLQVGEMLGPAIYAVFPDSEFTAETATGLLKVRRDIWLLLDDPTSSITARLVSLIIVLVILLSTVSFCVETVQGIHNRYDSIFRGLEMWCVLFFTAEFFLRITCTPSPRTFFLNTLNVVDLLAITPFYIEALVEASTTADAGSTSSAMLRAVRLIRVFRLLKVGRYLRWMQVFGKTLTASVAPLLMLLFIISIAALIFSTIAYFMERGVWDGKLQEWVREGAHQGEPSPFSSIPATFWWCIVTMTSVGFGDVVPVTPIGKFFATITAMCGIMLMAIPISVISGNFHGEYAHMRRLQALKAEHAKQPAPAPLDPLGQGAEEEGAAPGVGGADAPGAGLGPDGLGSPPVSGAEAPDSFATGILDEDGFPRRTKSRASSSAAGVDGLPPRPGARSRAESRYGTGPDGLGSPETAAGGGSARHQDEDAASLLEVMRTASQRAAAAAAGGGVGLSHPAGLGAGVGRRSSIVVPYRTAAQDDRITTAEIELLRRGVLVKQPSGLDVRAVERGAVVSATAVSAAAAVAAAAADPSSSFAIRRKWSRRTAGSYSIDGNGDGGDASSSGSSEWSSESEGEDGSGGVFGLSVDPRSLAAYANPARRRSKGSTGSEGAGGAAAGDTSGVAWGFESAVGGLGGAGAADDAAAAAAVLDAYLAAEEEEELGEFGGLSDAEAVLEAQRRIDASWSEPFLRTSLNIVRNSRRSLMSAVKSLELRNREHAVEDVKDFVGDIMSANRGRIMLRRASKTGLV
jgi:hypothetical protein